MLNIHDNSAIKNIIWRDYETDSIDLGDNICVLNRNSFIIYNILHRLIISLYMIKLVPVH